jgi:hypothetical protein
VGELHMDSIDSAQEDTRPLAETDPELWAKLSPDLKAKFEKYQALPGAKAAAPKLQLSPAAQAEHDAIYADHLYLTPSQVEALDMEAYVRWRELGSHMRPEPLTPEEQAAVEAQAAARAAEMQLLETADDVTYRQIRQEQDAVWRESAHEVITH